jgi:hypothetical protein
MAQDPLQIDQLQIEPGSGDTLTITRNAADGALKFVDAVVTGGVKLSELAGIQGITGVLVVGKSGTGAPYSAIQAALDAIPVSSSDTDPYVVLICPGVYQEDLMISRNGVHLVGLGGAVIQSATEATPNTDPADTITIQEGGGTVPEQAIFRNLHVTNAHDGYACIRVIGGAASEIGAVGVSIEGCKLTATGAGGYPVRASSVNVVHVQGGDMGASAPTALCLVEEVAEFTLDSVNEVVGLQLDYEDASATKPSAVGSQYRVANCTAVASTSTLATPISANLEGDGSLSISNCGSVANLTMNGDRSLAAVGCALGDVTLNGTSAATLVGCSRGAVAGAGTLAEPLQIGTADFATADTVSVAFTVAHPDDSYTVSLEVGLNALAITTNKAATGFDIEFPGGVQTTTVGWAAHRRM